MSALLVMGGSFCPVHSGHLAALRAARTHVETALGLRVVAECLACAPDGHVKQKYGKLLIPGEQRRALCGLVSTPTCRTFSSAQECGIFVADQEYPRGEIDHIVVVQGEDRGRPRKAQDSRVQFLTVARSGGGGGDRKGGGSVAGPVLTADAGTLSVSATGVREVIAAAASLDVALRELENTGQLPPEIIQYLATNPEIFAELRPQGADAAPAAPPVSAAPVSAASPSAASAARPTREVRAVFTESTVRVYQAYNDEIADAAVKHQSFVPPWKPQRMTWIKPSAIWMGYRCGWSLKDKNQARVLAVDLHRESFEWLLQTAVLAKEQTKDGDVVVQWDPERGLGGPGDKNAWTHPLPHQRSLQMGLRGEGSARFAKELVAAITDVTSLFKDVGARLEAGDLEGAAALLPREEVYPLPDGLRILGGAEDAEATEELGTSAKAQQGGDEASPAPRGKGGRNSRQAKREERKTGTAPAS